MSEWKRVGRLAAAELAVPELRLVVPELAVPEPVAAELAAAELAAAELAAAELAVPELAVPEQVESSCIAMASPSRGFWGGRRWGVEGDRRRCCACGSVGSMRHGWWEGGEVGGGGGGQGRDSFVLIGLGSVLCALG